MEFIDPFQLLIFRGHFSINLVILLDFCTKHPYFIGLFCCSGAHLLAIPQELFGVYILLIWHMISIINVFQLYIKFEVHVLKLQVTLSK
jgi:hypothetical protein